jgi:hypothetical protein
MSDAPAVADEAQPFGAATGWTGGARRLLARAIERHGGWAAWQASGGVSLRLASLTGRLPERLGVGRTFPAPTRIEVWPRRGLTVLHDYPVAGRRGVFTAGQVQILDGATILEARAEPRASLVRRRRRSWSALDALYVFGYALAHDQSLPFSLTAARPLTLRAARSGGQSLMGVEVELPLGLHTHGALQTFFFDGDGLLRRHDYVAKVVGWWASAAQLWDDYVDAGGVLVARRRRVVARLARFELSTVVLEAALDEVAPIPTVAPERPRLSLV